MSSCVPSELMGQCATAVLEMNLFTLATDEDVRRYHFSIEIDKLSGKKRLISNQTWIYFYVRNINCRKEFAFFLTDLFDRYAIVVLVNFNMKCVRCQTAMVDHWYNEEGEATKKLSM